MSSSPILMSVTALQVNLNPSVAKQIVFAVQAWLIIEVIGNKPWRVKTHLS